MGNGPSFEAGDIYFPRRIPQPLPGEPQCSGSWKDAEVQGGHSAWEKKHEGLNVWENVAGGGLVNYWMFRFEWCFLVKLNVVSFVVWVFFCFGFGYYVSFVTLCSSIYACMCSICLGISLGIPYGLRHFELNWVLVLLPIGLPIGLLGKCWGTPIQRTGNNLWSEMKGSCTKSHP